MRTLFFILLPFLCFGQETSQDQYVLDSLAAHRARLTTLESATPMEWDYARTFFANNGTGITDEYYTLNVGSGGSISYQPGSTSSKSLGYTRLISTTSASSLAILSNYDGDGSGFPSSEWFSCAIESRIACTEITDAGQIAVWGLAYTGDLPNAITDGIYFKVSSSDANIMCCTNDGTTTSCTDSGIAKKALSVWANYRIVYTLSTDAKFYIDGVLVATKSTNLPRTNQYISLYYGTRRFAAAFVNNEVRIAAIKFKYL